MKSVNTSQVVAVEAEESPLPPRSRDTRRAVGAAKEGLLAQSVGYGLSVVHELMESEVSEVVGPKGKHDPERVAVRHGHESDSVTLGGRRVSVSRPRMRSADSECELPVRTYECFADRDPLTKAVMDPMLAGVSTRRFAATRRAGRIGGRGEGIVDLALDGLGAVHRTHPHRGQRADGAPPGKRPPGGDDVSRASRSPSAPTSSASGSPPRGCHELARTRLELLATELDASWPDASRPLREGFSETLTLVRVGIGGNLAKTLASTSPCESMIEVVHRTQRNVKRWRWGPSHSAIQGEVCLNQLCAPNEGQR